VRVGPQTKKASEEQYGRLMAEHNSKVRELRKLIGKTVFWHSLSPFTGNADGIVVGCNQFFLTVHGSTYKRSFPIDWISISSEPDTNRYQLIVQH
jgi:hypothetical protein